MSRVLITSLCRNGKKSGKSWRGVAAGNGCGRAGRIREFAPLKSKSALPSLSFSDYVLFFEDGDEVRRLHTLREVRVVTLCGNPEIAA